MSRYEQVNLWPTPAERFSPEQSPSVHAYFKQILTTAVPLHELAARKGSAELRMSVEESEQLDNIIDRYFDQLDKVGEDTLRRLIAEVGGSAVPIHFASLASLKLERFTPEFQGEKGNPALGDILGRVVEAAVKGYVDIYPETIEDVIQDSEFQRRVPWLRSLSLEKRATKEMQQTIRDRVIQHLTGGVMYRLGIYR